SAMPSRCESHARHVARQPEATGAWQLGNDEDFIGPGILYLGAGRKAAYIDISFTSKRAEYISRFPGNRVPRRKRRRWCRSARRRDSRRWLRCPSMLRALV